MSPREKPRASGGTCSPGHGGRTSPGAAVRSGLCQDTAHQSPHLKGAKSFSIQWASPCPPTHVSHDTALCLWRTAPTPETHGEQGRPRTEMHTGRAGRLAGGKCSRVEDGL